MGGGKLIALAGGISSRMKKPSDDGLAVDQDLIKDANSKAKSMIGVGQHHRPFLDYLLYNARQAGYTDILIVIGENDESIRNYYGRKDRDNDFHGLKVWTLFSLFHREKKNPSALRMLCCRASLLK